MFFAPNSECVVSSKHPLGAKRSRTGNKLNVFVQLASPCVTHCDEYGSEQVHTLLLTGFGIEDVASC